ncbi:MAG: hypothetical protein ACXU8A_13495 [Burkholderiaceae bacterium]
MTSEDQKQSGDAEIAEFLEDRGKLVKRIQALSQLTPSAALDAAMLASHKSALSKSKVIQQAIVAGLMVAVLVSVIWYQSDDLLALFAQVSASTSAVAPGPEQAIANSVDATQKVEQTDVAVKAKNLDEAADKNVPTAAMMVAPATQSPVGAVKPAASLAEVRSLSNDKNKDLPMTAGASAPNDALHRNAERAQSEPAQAVAPQSKAKVDAVDKSAVTALAVVPAAVVSEPAAQTAVTAIDKAKAWLAAIEVMSGYESRREAASAQLERFEKSYPHYPVPEALRAKLKAPKN